MYRKPADGADITTWVPPNGATARLGRGGVSGKMAFSPDRTSLVVATTIGCWWYDIAARQPVALWATERGMVSAISFSRDGRWIATGNWDGIVKVWDSQTLQCVAEIDVPEHPVGKGKEISRLIFSPDGQYFAVSGRHRCAVYAWRRNLSMPIVWFTLSETPETASVAGLPISFSPNSSLLAYKSDYQVTSVMHVETGENIAEFPNAYTERLGYYQLAFSPCGQYLAACNRKGTVHVWNVHTGTLEMEPTVCGSIQVLPSYTSDGTLRVAGLYENEVVIWDAAQEKKVDTFEYRARFRNPACFSADGTQFAIASERGEVHVWTEGSPSTVVSLPGHILNTHSLVFSKDGSTLVSGTRGHSGILFWNVAQRQVERIFPALPYHDRPSSSHFAFSPSQELLATSGRRNTNEVGVIKIWNLVSGTQVAELVGHQKYVYVLAFSPTVEYLISVCPESIIIWDALRWKKRHVFSGNIDAIRATAVFHPNGKNFVTASSDGRVLLWDVERGEQLFSFCTTKLLDTTLYKGRSEDIQRVIKQQESDSRSTSGLTFSPCGTLLVGAIRDEGEIRVWDARTSETRMAILLPQSCQRQHPLTFSPCGDYLASGAWWQEGQEKVSIRLWEVATGENIATFCGHTTDVHDLAFSPDGTLLASASFDGTILLWDMTPYLQNETP
ncbi:MAG: WD40 repeat domain-containing protein [Candidatus Poribacteria bacterium]|nr:WD40 repeat domain-containing protein [Candidatus Poribacteria bacterium]MDD9972773.1 WD40 repeat domain-containing protein [Candidatus Poribacteria bacterium]